MITSNLILQWNRFIDCFGDLLTDYVNAIQSIIIDIAVRVLRAQNCQHLDCVSKLKISHKDIAKYMCTSKDWMSTLHKREVLCRYKIILICTTKKKSKQFIVLRTFDKLLRHYSYIFAIKSAAKHTIWYETR